ncbi:MAG: neutral zinc metallopeptidase [Bacteroidales bacterium]|nr:neutral zinc metallopeptidase [Bacteroidales bacterium]
MKLEGRRESTNVEDRRGKKTVAAAGGLGIGGIIIALIVMFMGGDPSQVTEQLQQGNTTEVVEQDYSQVDVELMTFCKRILAGTEDVWSREFQKMGRTYEPPKMVIFSDAVNSGCGNATSASGPFYCSADETVYLDLEFFKSMKKQIGADGDFAYAYVIAHEVGHHVQNQLGILGQAHQQMANYGRNTKESNEISVRLELQADFFAGVWAYNDNKMFGSLEDGDIEEALNAASKIGDDYLQKQAYGRTMPETFNHGTSAQRSRWLKKGLYTGDVSQGDTFSPAYSNL